MKRRKEDSCEKLDRIHRTLRVPHRTLRVPWIVLNVAMVVLLALASILLATLLSSPAQAMTAIVDSLADTYPYENPYTKVEESRDGICADEFGNCTLRAALEEADNRNEPAIITFSVTGTIRLIWNTLRVPDGSMIDGVGQQVMVDGSNIHERGFELRSSSAIRGIKLTTSSIGVSGNNNVIGGTTPETRNTISGGNISLGGNQNVVMGNDIRNDAEIGIGIGVYGNNNVIGGTTPETRNTISGGFYGISLGGNQNVVMGNDIIRSEFGIYVSGSNNVIGGTTPEMRNTISESTWAGIFIFYGNQSVVMGNDIIGRNLGWGIYVSSNDNVIGGTALGEYNVISENEIGVGIVLSQNNQVIGNFIGTDTAGNAWGNSSDGVSIVDSQGNTIAFNTIAFNGRVGIRGNGTENKISQNSIFANGSLGISFSYPFVTPNDPEDADSGPNNLQNFPVLAAASSDSTTIEGTLNSTPNTTFTIEFFSNSYLINRIQ